MFFLQFHVSFIHFLNWFHCEFVLFFNWAIVWAAWPPIVVMHRLGHRCCCLFWYYSYSKYNLVAIVFFLLFILAVLFWPKMKYIFSGTRIEEIQNEFLRPLWYLLNEQSNRKPNGSKQFTRQWRTRINAYKTIFVFISVSVFCIHVFIAQSVKTYKHLNKFSINKTNTVIDLIFQSEKTGKKSVRTL